MRRCLTLAKREFLSCFRTPLAWVLLSGFLLLSGFFFFGRLQWFNTALQQAAMVKDKVPTLNEHVVAPYFQTIEIILVFLIPILAMRAIAEERKSGTFELLITSPLRISELVLGKFLGLACVVFLMLSVSFIYPLVLLVFASPEMPPIIVGIVGMFLFSISFLSIGLAISASTSSQTVAGVVGLVVSLLFYAISLPAQGMSGKLGAVLEYLSPPLHTQELYRGVISSSDLIYFFSVILVGLFATSRILESSRWRK